MFVDREGFLVMTNNIAETLSNAGWLTVLDGPLHGKSGIAAALAIIGYVKTHHRRMLAREHWIRVPELTAGERSDLFTMEDALYGCHLRVGNPGRGRVPGRASPASRCRQASAATPRSMRPTTPRGGCRALHRRLLPGRAGPGKPDADRGS